MFYNHPFTSHSILKMMYNLSKIEDNVNRYRPEMLFRTGPKVKMKIVFIDIERVR